MSFRHSALRLLPLAHMLHAVETVQALNARIGLSVRCKGRVSLPHTLRVQKWVHSYISWQEIVGRLLRFSPPQIYRPGRDVISSTSSSNLGGTALPPPGLETHPNVNNKLVPLLLYTRLPLGSMQSRHISNRLLSIKMYIIINNIHIYSTGTRYIKDQTLSPTEGVTCQADVCMVEFKCFNAHREQGLCTH